MLPVRTHIPQEERCPVPEAVLGQLYRASTHGLEELVANVPSETCAMLALYCYRRAHLQTIGLAIASRCKVDDLETFGGNAGRALFEKARKFRTTPPAPQHLKRRTITLATGALRRVIRDEVSTDN